MPTNVAPRAQELLNTQTAVATATARATNTGGTAAPAEKAAAAPKSDPGKPLAPAAAPAPARMATTAPTPTLDAAAGSLGTVTTRRAPVPPPVAPAVPVAPADSAGGASNPLAGDSFYGSNTGAASAAAQLHGSRPQDAALLADLARVPTATWLGAWSGDVTLTVRQVVDAAQGVGGVPVFVAYDVPGRDCGGYSVGGEQSPAGYTRWIQKIADGIGTSQAVVIVEPDALAQLCGDAAARFQMLHAAVDVLEANPGTHTYLDAGNSDWINASTMAGRLRAAGVADADGFALNVSNFQSTANNEVYGRAVSSALGGAHFVIDTSRNGNGPGSDWCNPSGRAPGQRPTAATGRASVDAFLWVKTPGESDGTCNGGPAAGIFWPQYAIAFMRGV